MCSSGAFAGPHRGEVKEQEQEEMTTHFYRQIPNESNTFSVCVFIPESPAQLIVVHLGFTLPGPPQPGHLIRVLDDELSIVSLPGDNIVILFFPEQLQDEVPQLDLSGPGARLWLVSPLWESDPYKRKIKRAGRLAYETVNDVVKKTRV